MAHGLHASRLQTPCSRPAMTCWPVVSAIMASVLLTTVMASQTVAYIKWLKITNGSSHSLLSCAPQSRGWSHKKEVLTFVCNYNEHKRHLSNKKYCLSDISFPHIASLQILDMSLILFNGVSTSWILPSIYTSQQEEEQGLPKFKHCSFKIFNTQCFALVELFSQHIHTK